MESSAFIKYELSFSSLLQNRPVFEYFPLQFIRNLYMVEGTLWVDIKDGIQDEMPERESV